MKPYVMNYSQTIDLVEERLATKQVHSDIGGTVQTFTTENNDDDSVCTLIESNLSNKESTLVTNVVEGVDQDDVVYCSTLITRSTGEDDDQDFIISNKSIDIRAASDSTIITKSLESTDADSIH